MAEGIPPQVERSMRELQDAIARRVAGEDVDVAAAAAELVGEVEDAAAHDPHEVAIPPSEVVGKRIKELREAAGWRQERFAASVRRMGFLWRRELVVDIEKGRHPLTVDEVFAVAAQFGQPVAALLTPAAGEDIYISGHPEAPEGIQLSARRGAALVVGRGGRIGDGGPTWPTTHAGWDRPARDLHRNRRTDGKGTK